MRYYRSLVGREENVSSQIKDFTHMILFVACEPDKPSVTMDDKHWLGQGVELKAKQIKIWRQMSSISVLL